MNTKTKKPLPRGILESLRRYAEHGVLTGGFLQAVLENNLINAVFRADSANAQYLADIVRYCWDNLPSDCWGSRQAVDAHVKRKQLEKTRRRNEQ